MIALSPDDQARLTAGAAMWETAAVPAAGIPSIRMSDGPMGIASGRVDERAVARLSPCATALGASFDVDLIERLGALVGGEAIRTDVDLVLAPNVNLARSPLAGRAFEYFSEDPLLAGLAGAAWVRGLQSTGTGACPKHLVCNDSETDRDHMNAVVDERTLREVYLLPFELCAAAGATAMLTAYNRVNGVYCAEQGHVSTIVKTEWGFEGAFISDWFGTHSTVASLSGGLDLEMPGPARFLGAKSLAAVEAGEVPASRLADAASRVAAIATRWGGEKLAPAIDADALLVEAAAAGMVLLRNEAMLPLLPGSARRIAVIGPNAASPCYQGGTFAKIAVAPDAVRPLEAIRSRFGEIAEIVYEPGVDPQPRLPHMPVAPVRDLGDGCTSGMTIDYFADGDMAGAPISSETRDTNSLVWFVGVHDDIGVFDRPAAVRASGWFTAAADGEHLFYVGATGAVRMLVDGEPVLDKAERMPAKDVMGSLKRGDADSVGVTLAAGQRVRVDVEFRYDGARVHGLWYGIRGPDSARAMFDRAVAAASAADAVVLIVGETSDSSVESKDRADTRLASEQIALIEAVCAANPRTTIVANVGHAFDATWGDRAAALLCAWYPGEGFGTALADVLAGDREPGGRLPVTLARTEADYPALSLQPDEVGDLHYGEGVLVGYRGLAARDTRPLHAFGAGQGYTRFDLSDARADGDTIVATVSNTGDRRGAAVVQAYRRTPELALVGFGKLVLDAGATGDLRIAVEPRLLRVWSDAGWQRIADRLPVSVGFASDDLRADVEIEIEPPRSARRHHASP